MSNEHEFYRTPSWVLHELWAAVPQLHPREVHGILDPCCGDGAIIEAYRVNGSPRGHSVGYDIDRRKTAAAMSNDELSSELLATGDTLDEKISWRLEGRPVVMNPPFSRAFAFWRRAIDQQAEAVAMLAPLAFALPKRGRKELLEPRLRPNIIVHLSRRPSFTADGRTDMRDVCWYVWHSWLSSCEVRWGGEQWTA